MSRKAERAKEEGANSGQVVIFMMLAQLVLATLLGSSHNITVGGLFFALMSSFFQRNSVHEICQRGDLHSSFRHASWRRRIPMPHRARCNRHEARAGIAALISCCLVRLSTGGLGPPDEIVSLPACTQQRVRRGAALASRLDSLSFIGDKRGRCKALYFAVLNGTAFSDPEPVRFSWDLENSTYGQATTESTAEDIISAPISFTVRAAIVPLLDWLPSCVGHEICNPEDVDAVGDDSSFFDCDPTAVARLIPQNATL